jgi:ketosteroid isomerase-like protein
MRVLSLTATLSLLALASCGYGTPKTYSFSNAPGAEQHERLLWDAIKKKDRPAVSSHLASNYVFQGESGAKTKDQVLAELDQLNLTDFSMGNVNVTPQGADMIVTYDITLRGTRGGSPLPETLLHFMSVWQQQKSGWILIAQSEVSTR